MPDRTTIWTAAADLIEAGETAALATVCRKRGSLPLADDAKMLVSVQGRRMGTVGGGCVEADVIKQALETVRSGQPSVVQHTLNADLAGDVGLSCGGTVDLFLEPLIPSAELVDLLRGVAGSIEERQQVTVLTALHWDNGPRKLARAGGKGWSVGDWSGTLPWPAAGRRSAWVDEESQLFVEPIHRTPRVVIFGAGHVGVEIAKLAVNAGFYVVVVDDRDDFANAARIPSAHAVIADDFNKVIDGLTFEADDFILATTRGHQFDATIIERTAASRAGYVGMLGSGRKMSVVRKALLEAGVPAEALDRVHCPIGEAIGADTPAEIAVSVVAELIKMRRKGDEGRGTRDA